MDADSGRSTYSGFDCSLQSIISLLCGMSMRLQGRVLPHKDHCGYANVL